MISWLWEGNSDCPSSPGSKGLVARGCLLGGMSRILARKKLGFLSFLSRFDLWEVGVVSGSYLENIPVHLTHGDGECLCPFFLVVKLNQ